ncbi:MAG TPA: radical SAM protein [Candidatus Sulfopaludibacter sp.]|jgi:molybdenum cofactor biosynthesis enzyme MoaA|nr:radical SAM protein [Candidatus Sulfopaludibacter sp.]
MSDLRPNQTNKYRALWELAHGKATVVSTPPKLQFARNNVCNFKCVYCSDHRPGNQIPRNHLEGEVWQNLVKLIPQSEQLAFHGISEFFVDTEFFDILGRSAAAGATLRLNTNGSVCTPRHLDALANYPGYLNINFSLDAATPETFLRIRGQDFWKIVQKIKSYMDRFESRRSESWITLSFVINRSNVKEMLPFLFLAKALKVDGVTFYRMHEYESLDWKVDAKQGGVFDYREECTGKFADEYNRELENVRQAAALFGVQVDLPAPVAPEELVAISQ